MVTSHHPRWFTLAPPTHTHWGSQSERRQTIGHTPSRSSLLTHFILSWSFQGFGLNLWISHDCFFVVFLNNMTWWSLGVTSFSSVGRLNYRISMNEHTGKLSERVQMEKKQMYTRACQVPDLLFSKGCQEQIASASMSAAHFPHILEVTFLHLNIKPFTCKGVCEPPV